MWVRLSVGSVALVGAVFAVGQTSEGFEFQPDRHVYTVPRDFIPEKLSAKGLADLERDADRLHYPFYIVFYRSLPTATGSSTDRDAERVVTGLADQWATNEGFERNKSSLFLVSYGPGDRKFRLMPAPLWRTELGLEGDRLTPYLQVFRNNARRNPQSAIAGMMKQYDTAIYDGFDPARKAQLAAIRAREQRERELAQAKADLALQVNTTKDAIRRAHELGLADNTALEREVSRATALLETGTTRQLTHATNSLQTSSGVLWNAVHARESAVLAEQQRLFALIFAALVGLIGLIVFSVHRVRLVRRLREQLQERVGLWRGWITEARQRYYVFDENRERAKHLASYGPETAALYHETVQEIDEVIIGVEAVANLLDAAEGRAKLGGFFTVMPLRSAVRSLDQSVEFETGQISNRLFDPQRKVVEITPSEFLARLSDRYDQAVAKWQRLNQSVDQSLQAANDLFPHSGLDGLIAKANDNGIPLRWISSHPLFGDDASDQSVWAKASECRTSDPVAYARQIQELRDQEAKLSSDLDRLIAAQSLANQNVVEAIVDLEETVLATEDDPRVSLLAAKDALGRLSRSLHTATTVEEVEELGHLANERFEQTQRQWTEALDAIRHAETLISAAEAHAQALAQDRTRAEASVRDACRVHVRTDRAENAVEVAGKFLTEVEMALADAKSHLAARRHLNAVRKVSKAESQMASAQNWIKTADEVVLELNRERRRYEEKLAQMDYLYGSAAQRMRRYGGSLSPRIDYRNQTLRDQAYDFALMYTMLQRQEDQWNQAVWQAQVAFQAAESARQSAAMASHTSSAGFSSGSSGGSFSSGNSGSSGGSW